MEYKRILVTLLSTELNSSVKWPRVTWGHKRTARVLATCILCDVTIFHVHALQTELTIGLSSAHPHKLLRLHFDKSSIANDARYTREIKSRIAMAKAEFNKDSLFTSKLNCNLRKKHVKCYIWSIALCGAGTGHCGKCIRYTRKIMKRGAGEGWRKSVGPIVWGMRKCYKVKEERYILHTIKGITDWTHLAWDCPVRKHVNEEKIEAPRRRRRRSGYYMTLWQGKDTGNWKRKH